MLSLYTQLFKLSFPLSTPKAFLLKADLRSALKVCASTFTTVWILAAWNQIETAKKILETSIF